jgi:hypothetical protein
MILFLTRSYLKLGILWIYLKISFASLVCVKAVVCMYHLKGHSSVPPKNKEKGTV